MNIKGLDKAEVLAALYNGSKAQGMGWIHFDANLMTKEEAQKILDEYGTHSGAAGSKLYFDYLKGRVMKVDLSGDELDTFLFNRDNGDGAAERIIESLKASRE